MRPERRADIGRQEFVEVLQRGSPQMGIALPERPICAAYRLSRVDERQHRETRVPDRRVPWPLR